MLEHGWELSEVNALPVYINVGQGSAEVWPFAPWVRQGNVLNVIRRSSFVKGDGGKFLGTDIDEPRGQGAGFLRLAFGMLSIAVAQTLPDNVEVCLARALGELWIPNLNVTRSACLCLYELTVSKPVISIRCMCALRLTWASAYRQHRWVTLVQLQHRLIAVESKNWKLFSIQITADFPSHPAEVTRA